MPAWDEYRDSARARGNLAMELYVVSSTPASSPEALDAALPDHLAYQKSMEAAGTLFLAGPVSDRTGALMEGEGLIVYRAGSLEEARGIAENDPMHKRGVRRFTIRKWLVNEGSLSVSLSLSDQSLAFG